MRTGYRPLAGLLLAALAGCGTAAHATQEPIPEVTQAGAPFLASSLVTGAGTWAVAVMGGAASAENNFWQLFVRPTGSASWKLVTPPGVPDNGGLVVAGGAGGSLIGAVRPSQYLTFTPLAATHDGGQAWSPTGPLDAALANVPDALSVAPGSDKLLALLTSGSADLAAPGYTKWHRLVSHAALAATAAGRRCGVGRLTAAAFSPAGVPMLAGSCGHPGAAGIFTDQDGRWRAAGLDIPGALAHRQVTVLRLTTTGGHVAALLRAGGGPGADLLAAWSATGDGRWFLSAPLPAAAAVYSASLTPASTVVRYGKSAAAFVPASGGRWLALPRLPAGTATVAPGPAGGFDALAVHRATLTVWRLGNGAATWHVVQVIKVPVQFGSSG